MTSIDIKNLHAVCKDGFKSILIALQEGNTDKANDICRVSLKWLDRIENNKFKKKRKG